MCIVTEKCNGKQCASEFSVDTFLAEFAHFDELMTSEQISGGSSVKSYVPMLLWLRPTLLASSIHIYINVIIIIIIS